MLVRQGGMHGRAHRRGQELPWYGHYWAMAERVGQGRRGLLTQGRYQVPQASENLGATESCKKLQKQPEGDWSPAPDCTAVDLE